MTTLAPYKTTPVFDADTCPDGLRRAHATKAGVWGVLEILDGDLSFVEEESGAKTLLTAGQRQVILPQQWHHVEITGPVRFQVRLYDRPITIRTAG